MVATSEQRSRSKSLCEESILNLFTCRHRHTLLDFWVFPYFALESFSHELHNETRERRKNRDIIPPSPSAAAVYWCWFGEEFLKHFDWQLTTLSRVRPYHIFISSVEPLELSICHSKMPNFSIYIMPCRRLLCEARLRCACTTTIRNRNLCKINSEEIFFLCS